MLIIFAFCCLQTIKSNGQVDSFYNYNHPQREILMLDYFAWCAGEGKASTSFKELKSIIIDKGDKKDNILLTHITSDYAYLLQKDTIAFQKQLDSLIIVEKENEILAFFQGCWPGIHPPHRQ